jgi:prepilin-type N-terminal cleavage/methylation domain-containing protein
MRRSNSKGFTLLELLVSISMMLVVSAAVFNLLVQGQKNYSTTAARASMHAGVRGAAELMAQEISQAGLITLPAGVTINTAVTSAGSATVNLSPASTSNSIYKNEYIMVDTGAKQEWVQVTNVGTGNFTATFANTHAVGAAVNAKGTILNAIPQNPPTTYASDGSNLVLIGDILGNGTLYQVKYTCDTTVNHTLTRSASQITPTASSILASDTDTLLDNVEPNPNGTACFQYQTDASGNVIGAIFTITVQTQYQTQAGVSGLAYSTMTKTFVDLTARNIMAAVNMNASGMGTQVQSLPTNVPLH